MLELHRIGDVPQGPDAINRRSELFVGRHVSPFVDSDATDGHIGQVAVRGPTGGHQQLVGLELRSVGQCKVEGARLSSSSRSVGLVSDMGHGRLEEQAHPGAVDLGEATPHICIGTSEEQVAAVDNGDTATQPLENVGHLYRDEPAPENH